MSHPKPFCCFTHRNISEGKGIEIAVVLSYMGEKKWQEEENVNQYHNKLYMFMLGRPEFCKGGEVKLGYEWKEICTFYSFFCLNFYGVLYYFYDP